MPAPPVTYRIHGIPSFTGSRTTFLASYFEVEVPDSTVASGYRNVKLTGAQLVALVGSNPATNAQRGGPFAVTYRDDQQAGYVTGCSTLASLDESLLCFGARAFVEQSPDGNNVTYVPVYDPAGPLHINKDGYFGPDVNIPARWVLIDSPSAAYPAYSSLPAGYSFTADSSIVRSYAGGATEYFYKALNDGPLPDVSDPDGDVNWELIGTSGDVPPVLITRAEFDGLGNRVTQTETRISTLEDGQVWFLVPGGGNNICIGPFNDSNIWGTGSYNNILESGIAYVEFGDGLANCRFGAGLTFSQIGDSCSNLIIGPGCTGLNIGPNCVNVELYDCRALNGVPFTVPAGTQDAIYRHNVLVSSGSGAGTAGTARLLVSTEQGKRVAVLPIESSGLVVSDVVPFDHAATMGFQLNFRTAGNWAPGPQLSLSALNVVLGSLLPSEIDEGVEMEIESRITGAVSSQFLGLFSVHGLQGFSTLPGTRPARRVYNPNSSPEPTVGFAFNTNGATMQSFSIPNPAVNQLALAFWMKRNTAPGSGPEYWLASARPANNAYFTVDSNEGVAGAYVSGQFRGSSLLGSPVGQWVPVVVNFNALSAGTINLFTGNPGTGTGPVNVEIYDVRLYGRQFTAGEIADPTSAPADSLLARFTFPYTLDTSTGTVPDESGNNNHGTLYNF
jgi:hypothetical protein